MRRGLIRVAAAIIVVAAEIAEAVDHKNLDEGRPLRLEDAYTIADGEFSIETGAGFALLKRGPDRGLFPIEILYGAVPNLQLGVGSTLFTDPHDTDDRPKSGDLRVSVLYNFNQEALTLPAFAARLTLTLPTGVDAHGYGVELKGIVTKSVDRLSFHLNAAYEFLTDAERTERDGRYELALGVSYPIGAPHFTRATLVGDVFADQPATRGESTIVGLELGLRYQLTPSIVWDVGVGTEFAGPASRSPFFVMTGLSLGF